MKIGPETNFSPVHPVIVAQDFEVHLRTVFRWVDRKLLKSKKGRIVTDYKKSILPDWQTSLSHEETQKRLDISQGTLTNWLRKGILKRVLKSNRISLSSVEEVIRLRNSGTFSMHPTHNFPNIILE